MRHAACGMHADADFFQKNEGINQSNESINQSINQSSIDSQQHLFPSKHHIRLRALLAIVGVSHIRRH
jgi:hypothetical protein